MNENTHERQAGGSARRTRGGGGAARRAERTAPRIEATRYITRNIPDFEILTTEAIEIIEDNAETVLEEIGVNFVDNPAALARWRDAGGLLEVHELALAWGPLDLRAEGTAALDQRLRPQGAFTARIRGLPDALDAFAARGLIEPGVAFALKLTALTLAKRRDEAGTAVVELPITPQDGLFYLGPVALFPLSPVL